MKDAINTHEQNDNGGDPDSKLLLPSGCRNAGRYRSTPPHNAHAGEMSVPGGKAIRWGCVQTHIQFVWPHGSSRQPGSPGHAPISGTVK